jgi:hypothetical protein
VKGGSRVGEATDQSDARAAFWLAILVASVILLFHGSALGSSDGTSMYEVAKSIVEDGDVAINRGVVWKGRDGHFYSPYGIGLSLLAIIPYVVVRPFARMTSEPESVLQAGVAALMPVIVALLAAALYGLSRRLGGTSRNSLIVALGSVFGTFLLVYSKDFFGEPLAALFLVLSVERAVARKPGLSGAAAAAAALTRPQCFAFAPLLLWRLHKDGGWVAVRRAALPILGSVAVSLTYNFVRFGDVFNFGYSTELPQGFTNPFLSGAAGLLFHPKKSILLFAPISLLLPLALRFVWKAHRTAFWLLTGNLVITFVISAKWWDWGGGWVWGPRLLIPGIIPPLAALGVWSSQGRLRIRWVVPALFALGFLVNVPAVIVGVGAQFADGPIPPVGPSVVRQAELVPAAVAYTLNHAYDPDPTWSEAASRVAIWQFRATRALGRQGLPIALFGSLLLTCGALIAAFQLRRVLGTMERRFVAVTPLPSV